MNTFIQGQDPYKTMDLGQYKKGFYRFDSVAIDFIEKTITINQRGQIHIVYDIWNKWCEALIDRYNNKTDLFYKNNNNIYRQEMGSISLREDNVFELNSGELSAAGNIIDYTLTFNNNNEWALIFPRNLTKLKFLGGNFKILPLNIGGVYDFKK